MLARLVGFVQPKVAIAQTRDLLDQAVQQERFDLATASSAASSAADSSAAWTCYRWDGRSPRRP